MNAQQGFYNQQGLSFEGLVTRQVRMEYLLHLPAGYEADPSRAWPLVLFLHGRGERGSDLQRLTRHGLPKLIQAGHDLPFIVVSPQCPEHSWWVHELDTLNALLDRVTEQYRVDAKRIYLTGLSMGGFGCWHMAAAYPERFAAAVPICGGGNPRNAERLKDLPIWAFHGQLDQTVPLSESTAMVDAVRACGGNVRLTIYIDAAHDSWTRTYENPELYTWLAAQSRV